MSVVLNGSSQFLRLTSALAGGLPFTVIIWFKPDINTTNMILAAEDWQYTSGYKIHGCVEASGGVASDPVRGYSYNGSSFGIATTTTGFSTGSWQMASGRFTSTTSRAVSLDGSGKGTNTDSITGDSNEFIIGARRGDNPIGHFDGKIAYVVVWDKELTDAQITSLAGGTYPGDIESGSIIGLWKLHDDNTATIGTNLTEVGSPTYDDTDDPPVSPPAVIEHVAATISGVGSIVVDATSILQKTSATISGAGGFNVNYSVTNIYDSGLMFPTRGQLILPGWMNDTDAASQWNLPDPATVPTPAALVGDDDRTGQTPVRQANASGLIGGNVFEQHWFEHAHMLPRVIQNVGNVVTEQQIQCELYNADRKDSITVSSITDNLGTGFTVVGVPATPFNIASQEGLSFQIKVLQSGDLTIDGDYTMTLSTGETYTIYIIGTRIVLLPVRPEAPLREHLIFDTKIVEHIDASEQRIFNREKPRGEFEMRFKGDDRKRLELLLFDRQSKVIAVPAWHEPSFLASAHSSGVDTVTVNTTNYANFYVGGYAVILQDEHTFDALKIQAITATTIQFESNLSNSYAANTQVMPLMTAYAMPTTPMVKAAYNEQDFNVRLRVPATPNDIASAAAFSTYNSKVFLDDPNLIERDLKEALETKVYVLDNGTGDLQQFALWDHALRHSRKGFKTNSRQQLWELRQLFHYLKGMQVSFYIPTFSKDLVPNQTLLNASSTFTMDHIGYTVNADKRWPKQVFRMHLKDGTILTRTIQNASEVSSSVEQLTVDTAWPYDIEPEDIERVEFLEKVRFDTDDIIIVHYNALGESQSIVATKEVSD